MIIVDALIFSQSMKTKYFIFLLPLFGIVSTVFSQGQVATDINGSIINTKKYTELNGSVYFTDSWATGSVKFANGKSINKILLKYNQLSDEPVFAGKNDMEYVFNDLVVEFSLNDTLSRTRLFRNGFPATKQHSSRAFYEILADGNIKLLKKNTKKVMLTKEFNSATSVQTVTDNIEYFLYADKGLIPFKKAELMKFLANFNENKSVLTNEFVKKNKLNLKKEDDLVQIVNYYNQQK